MALGLAIRDGQHLTGRLRYVSRDYAFRFDADDKQQLEARRGAEGLTSLAVGTLQIEVGVSTRECLYVWGLHAAGSWQAAQVGQPTAGDGVVTVAEAVELRPGVTQDAVPGATWQTFYDKASGWLRISAADRASDSEALTLISTATVLGITDGHLTSVWLKPWGNLSIAD